MLNAVCSIVFLATPHRGSGFADTLNRFLSVSFQSPKQYVSDLQKNSARIIDINDQFRLYADRIQIVSFFETQPTSLGVKKAVSKVLPALRVHPLWSTVYSQNMASSWLRESLLFWIIQMRYLHR